MIIPDDTTSLMFILQETQYEISLYENILMENKYKALKYLTFMIVPMIIAMTVISLFHFNTVFTPTVKLLLHTISWISWFIIIRCITGWIRCRRNVKTCKDAVKLLRLVITRPEFLNVLFTITKVTIDEEN